MKYSRMVPDAQPERNLIIGLVTSTTYCHAIVPILDVSLLRTSYCRTIAYWIIIYFKKHQKAPFLSIQKIYEDEASHNSMNDSEAKTIESFLSGVSREYDSLSENFDIPYQIEKTTQYLRQRRIDVLRGELKDIQSNEIDAVLNKAKTQLAEMLPHTTLENWGKTGTELKILEIKKPLWIVHEIIPSGLTLLCGKPKAGKSFFALNAAIAVATKGKAFGHRRVRAGRVLYLGLEDNWERLKSRLTKMTKENDDLHNLTLATVCEPIQYGGRKRLQSWLESDTKKTPRLIVVDTLEKVRTRGSERSYTDDYNAIQGLQSLSQEYNISIIVIHHTRKAKGEEVFDEISGTYGLYGAADAALILQRHYDKEIDATVHLRGRDIDDHTLAFDFGEDFNWECLGPVDSYQRVTKQQMISDVLANEERPMTPRELKARIPGFRSRGSLYTMLHNMKQEGKVCITPDSMYVHPDFYRKQTRSGIKGRYNTNYDYDYNNEQED